MTSLNKTSFLQAPKKTNLWSPSGPKFFSLQSFGTVESEVIETFGPDQFVQKPAKLFDRLVNLNSAKNMPEAPQIMDAPPQHDTQCRRSKKTSFKTASGSWMS